MTRFKLPFYKLVIFFLRIIFFRIIFFFQEISLYLVHLGWLLDEIWTRKSVFPVAGHLNCGYTCRKQVNRDVSQDYRQAAMSAK